MEERIQLFYEQEFFRNHEGLPEALVDYEIKNDLKFPNQFTIPPFITYDVGESKVILGKVHKQFLFGMPVKEKMHYKIFNNKMNMKLFFTQMTGIEREHLAFWLTEVENIEFNINLLTGSR